MAIYKTKIRDEKAICKSKIRDKKAITSRHNISPIEVKSGDRYSFTSLRKCRAKYGPYLSTSYLIHDKDLKIEDDISFVPIYMTPLL